MSYVTSPLQSSAGRLSTWLNVWRILYLVLGAIGLLGVLAGLVFIPASDDVMGNLAGWLKGLALLSAVLIGLSMWVYWQLLSWGKEWVDRSAGLALGGGDTGRLRQLEGTLGRWITGIVWAVGAMYLLGALLGGWIIPMAAGAVGSELGSGGLLAMLILFVILAGVYLVGTYFPYTALRRFLSAATGRLGGHVQPLRPHANRLNTWCIVLVVLQILSVLFNLIPDEDSGGAFVALLTTLFAAGFSLLYILPLLAAGNYAKALADTLDQQTSGGLDAAAPAPRTDYSQMGRLADQNAGSEPPSRC